MLTNIESLLFMENAPDGRTLKITEFESYYQIEVDGINCYMGLNAAALVRLKTSGIVLNPEHQAVIGDAIAHSIGHPGRRTVVNIGLWPYEPTDPYQFLLNNPKLIDAVARELAVLQAQALDQGGNLDFVVRFASEMNDPATEKQPWGRHRGVPDDEPHQELFRMTFDKVRRAFQAIAPRIKFTFSPAVRADVDAYYEYMLKYLPASELIDFYSCTWYVGKEADLAKAFSVLSRYYRDVPHNGTNCGIDEIGGIDGTSGNDRILSQMFDGLESLKTENVSFSYVSVFLLDKWAIDATLEFLR